MITGLLIIVWMLAFTSGTLLEKSVTISMDHPPLSRRSLGNVGAAMLLVSFVLLVAVLIVINDVELV